MKLTDVASDLFLFLVTFRRQVRKNIHPELGDVRNQLMELFERMDARAGQDPQLEQLYRKARYPLAVTADEILINSNWTYASQWEYEILEYEFFKTRIAGEQFFTMIEDLGDEEEELAEIFYHCLCLGFVGRYKDDAEELRRLKRRLYRMLPSRVTEDERRITPEAYHTEKGTGDPLRPMVNLGRIVLVCATLLVVLWVGSYIYVNHIMPARIESLAQAMKQRVAPEAVATPAPALTPDGDDPSDATETPQGRDAMTW